jgi:hypothetical protein
MGEEGQMATIHQAQETTEMRGPREGARLPIFVLPSASRRVCDLLAAPSG